MPRAQANKAFSTFNKGLITEAGPLNFPPDSTTDESNCDLFTKGNRRRRLGFDLESGRALSTQTVALDTWKRNAVGTSTWKTVDGDGNKNFLVVQIGLKLYFYDLAERILVNAQQSFSVNLEDFAVSGVSNQDVSESLVQVASGKGLLFVVGEKIESFYLSYDSDTGFITQTQINIKIRDFDGVDDNLENDEEPTVLSNEHHYNLRNQGWIATTEVTPKDPIDTYFASDSTYPGNNKQWWVAKDTSNNFVAATLQKLFTGNTLAPRGHYVLDAFNKDRSTASGIDGLTRESVSTRPDTVAFFQGRAFYAGVTGGGLNGNVYFSQIIEDNSKIGRCHQVNDPTSEDLSDLLATDGGVINIPDAGTILKLFPVQGSILVFADNGIWSISGTDGGFKATDFAVSKVSSVGIDGHDSIVDVEGTPIWWDKTGIQNISQNDVNDKFGVQSLSKDTIQTLFDDIPSVSKGDAKGMYDRATKKIYWAYRSTAATNRDDRYRFDTILVLDVRLGAFYPWTISTFDSEPYYIGGMLLTDNLNDLTEDENVLDGTDEVVDSTDDVYDFGATVSDDTFLKWFCFKEGTTNVQWSFGNFDNTSFFDWESIDGTGVSYSSFFETGDELLQDIQRKKQATYVQTYFNRTETAYTDTNYDTFVRPSGCLMQSKWEWADNSNSNKYGRKQQVYKIIRTYTPDTGEVDFDNGFPVTVTKVKIRGSGKALKVRYESEEGKDFDILGWAIAFSGNTSV